MWAIPGSNLGKIRQAAFAVRVADIQGQSACASINELTKYIIIIIYDCLRFPTANGSAVHRPRSRLGGWLRARVTAWVAHLLGG